MNGTSGDLRNNIEKTLITADEIAARVGELGRMISGDYVSSVPVLAGVLKGCFIFMADLARSISIPVEVDFIAAASYGDSTRSSGVVRITKDIDMSITGRHVLIVEDIVDTGLTLDYLIRMLKTRNPLSVKVCALFDKPSGRKLDIKADYSGFLIPDRYVVGYGLDHDERYRNLPDACLLKEEH